MKYVEGVPQPATQRFAKSASGAAGSASRQAGAVRMYYGLAKPGIVYSNVMTAAAGFLLASKGHVNFALALSLLGGTALIIASACVFNNYIDRGIDAKMARTKKRAIASGEISAKSALIYAVLLGILGFLILSGTNWLTVMIGFVAIFSYVVLYGIAKRKTVHGTLVGTIPGAASLVAGYTAVSGKLDAEALILFLIMVAWQMPHFYSIAMYRLSDYKAAKIPVNPLVRGMKNTKFQIICYVFIFILACSALSVFGYAGLSYRVAMLAVGTYWLYKAVKAFETHDDAKWARGMFGFSLIVLLVFSTMISLNSWLP
jgi:protoheme IX farnesyltransferase